MITSTTPPPSRNTSESIKTPPDAAAAPDKSPPPFFRRPGVVTTGMILLPFVFATTAYLTGHAWVRESTDDAFVDADVVSIAPRVSGKVISLSVTDNELVAGGSPILEIDPADFQARVDQDTQTVAVDQAIADSKEAAYQQAIAHVNTTHEFTASALASTEQARADAARLHDDLARNKELVDTRVISQQEYDDSSKTTAAATAALNAKEAQQNAAVANETESARQLDSAKAQWQSAKAQIEQAQAALAESKLQLAYTKVTAPVTGRVTERTVNTGDYLQVGQQVLALVPPQVWITANFKETQLQHMRVGQPVDIRVDAYPRQVLQGHVQSIQAGSGARFSLLPPENATGNYVKVVQRVPVKIVLDKADDHLLGPGMSVEPSVLISDSAAPLIVTAALAVVASLATIVLGINFLHRSEVS